MSGPIFGESSGSRMIAVGPFAIGTTGDTSVAVPFSSYTVRRATLYGASASLALTTALVSLRTAAAGAGSAIVSSQIPTVLTAATVILDSTIALTGAQTASTLFLRVVQGLTPTVATCKCILEVQSLP